MLVNTTKKDVEGLERGVHAPLEDRTRR